MLSSLKQENKKVSMVPAHFIPIELKHLLLCLMFFGVLDARDVGFLGFGVWILWHIIG